MPRHHPNITHVILGSRYSGKLQRGGSSALIFQNGRIQELVFQDLNSHPTRHFLVSCIEILKALKNSKGKVVIHTCSKDLIEIATSRIFIWEENNWKKSNKTKRTKLLNLDLLIYLAGLLKTFEGRIEWRLVPNGKLIGRAFCLAGLSCRPLLESVILFQGEVRDYPYGTPGEIQSLLKSATPERFQDAP